MKRSIIKKKGPIYLLTDMRISGLSHSSQARRAVAGGIRIIQLRDKDMSKRDLYMEAVKIRAITADAGALFLVNDYLDIAIACKADGVHLGQEDLPVADARKIGGRTMIVGVSTPCLGPATEAHFSTGPRGVALRPQHAPFPSSSAEAALP